MRYAIAAVLLGFATAGLAADAGEIKTVSGTVHLERAGKKLPAKVGTPVQQADTVVTGADGAAGIVFTDNSPSRSGRTVCSASTSTRSIPRRTPASSTPT